MPPLKFISYAAVWSGLTADALSRLGVSAAAVRIALALQPIASLLGKRIASVISPAAQAVITSAAVSANQLAILDEAARKGLKRLQDRAERVDVDLWQLLWMGDTAGWEEIITQSFAAGMSLDLEEPTVQHQLWRFFNFRGQQAVQRVQQLRSVHANGIWHSCSCILQVILTFSQ
jgi:hypothetical protein